MISTSRGPYFSVPIFERSTFGMSAILYSVRDFEVVKILLVTDSGAGAPFVRLYLIPKSALGPVKALSVSSHRVWDLMFGQKLPTTWVVTRSQEDTARSFPLPDNVAGGWCAEDAILSYQEPLDSICCSDFGNQLHHLRVVISSVSSNDQEAAFYTFRDRQEYASDERLAVVSLLKNSDPLAKAGSRALSAIRAGLKLLCGERLVG